MSPGHAAAWSRKAGGDQFQRLIPACLAKAFAVTNQRGTQTIFVVRVVQPNLPLIQVEMPFAGPAKGSILRISRSLVQMSNEQPTPQ